MFQHKMVQECSSRGKRLRNASSLFPALYFCDLLTAEVSANNIRYGKELRTSSYLLHLAFLQISSLHIKFSLLAELVVALFHNRTLKTEEDILFTRLSFPILEMAQKYECGTRGAADTDEQLIVTWKIILILIVVLEPYSLFSLFCWVILPNQIHSLDKTCHKGRKEISQTITLLSIQI